jgi:hypothetical protein
MGVEHHFLRLAQTSAHVGRPPHAEPDMRHLHPQQLASDLDVLVALVELVTLALAERQRDEGSLFRRLSPR